jgi:hypothetical protein
MAPKRKTKKKKFSAVDTVKAIARERIGSPRPSRIVPVQRKEKSEKHKPALGKLLQEE